eukprot:TRINITY_DN14371_c0_g1_i1.p1 TRINITY_DN14371_c0_g1~~TRINITY_DN14371_c0_g1_i1.p1  ORF type:complete len:654 (+),score=132.08 TRINITY_DN14371_c0_g1_i1:124-2085(+)
MASEISAIGRSIQWERALAIFASKRLPALAALPSQQGEQRSSTLRSLSVLHSSAISACGRGLQGGFALRLLEEASALRLPPNLVSFNAAVSALEKRGRWEQALAMIYELRSATADAVDDADASKHSEDFEGPDVFTCSAVLSACGRKGRWREALAVLGDMRCWKIVPNVVSYTAVLNACDRGNAWLHALGMLSIMQISRISANAITFHAGIAAVRPSWNRHREYHGNWYHSLSLLSQMQQQQIRANAVALSDALASCDAALQIKPVNRILLPGFLRSAISWISPKFPKWADRRQYQQQQQQQEGGQQQQQQQQQRQFSLAEKQQQQQQLESEEPRLRLKSSEMAYHAALCSGIFGSRLQQADPCLLALAEALERALRRRVLAQILHSLMALKVRNGPLSSGSRGRDSHGDSDNGHDYGYDGSGEAGSGNPVPVLVRRLSDVGSAAATRITVAGAAPTRPTEATRATSAMATAAAENAASVTLASAVPSPNSHELQHRRSSLLRNTALRQAFMPSSLLEHKDVWCELGLNQRAPCSFEIEDFDSELRQVAVGSIVDAGSESKLADQQSRLEPILMVRGPTVQEVRVSFHFSLQSPAGATWILQTDHAWVQDRCFDTAPALKRLRSSDDNGDCDGGDGGIRGGGGIGRASGREGG